MKALFCLAIWLSVVIDHIPAGSAQNTSGTSNEILFKLYQQYWAANPISGSNFPPPETLSSQRFQGVPDITVKSQFWVEYIRVDEPNHAFHARYWWAMNYPDYRTQDLISETNASSNCAQLCSTHANLVLNMYGDNACCTAVYMPNSYFQNIIGGSLQDQPNEWVVFAVQDTGRVQYWARATSMFSATFKYGAFPFDRQTLTFRLLNEFIPEINPAEALQLMSPSALIPVLSTFRQDASAFREFGIEGWRVIGKTATVTSFKQKSQFRVSNDSLAEGQDRQQPGIIFSIEIQRTTTGFWIQLLVLPIMLLILFSFFSFTVHGKDIRQRMELMSGMFLAILLLQYTVRDYLPGNQAIMPPYLVLVVSYIYLLVLACVYLLTHTLYECSKTNTTKIKVLEAQRRSIAFQRSQLQLLLRQKSTAKRMMHMPSHAAAEEVSHEIQGTDQEVNEIDRKIQGLKEPFHPEHMSTKGSKILQLLLMRRMTRSIARWFACLEMLQAEDYCHSLAISVERFVLVFLTTTYLLITSLVYYISYRGHVY